MPDDELTYMTDAHVAVIRALEKRGLGLLYEIDFPPYRVDIYLPDYHAAVEIDGPQHTFNEVIERDKDLGDMYFLPVFHIFAENAKRPGKWMDMLKAFLNQARPTRDERYAGCEMKTPWL